MTDDRRDLAELDDDAGDEARASVADDARAAAPWMPVSADLAMELLGEGIHTGLRKGSDAHDAHELWLAIDRSESSAWSDALRYFISGLDAMGFAICEKGGVDHDR